MDATPHSRKSDAPPKLLRYSDLRQRQLAAKCQIWVRAGKEIPRDPEKSKKCQSYVFRRDSSSQQFKQSIPILLRRGVWPIKRPTPLAFDLIWSSWFSQGQDPMRCMEEWLRNVGACDCFAASLRGFLLHKEKRRTSELLSDKHETRPWSRILDESWTTGIPPWQIAPSHPVVTDWFQSLPAGYLRANETFG